jgi:predicted RNA methylase
MRRFVQPRQEDVFLDYGSGMGRVLLMAATFPFHRVIGVEHSEELSANATRIIEQVKKRLRCKAIQVVTADASDYDLPVDVTVIYFYNPFGGDVLEKTIRKIKKSVDLSPRKIQIVYYDPSKFEKLVHDCGWLIKKVEVVFPAVDKCRIAIYENRM